MPSYINQKFSSDSNLFAEVYKTIWLHLVLDKTVKISKWQDVSNFLNSFLTLF